MFFEVHRLGIFTPRSLDIDVVYDVMIHDLDILLALVNAPVDGPESRRHPGDHRKSGHRAGAPRICNRHRRQLTASRVSTERVRKMRFFQEHEYISLDFTRQDVLRVRVRVPASALMPDDASPRSISRKLPATPDEPLRAELRAFLDSVRTRKPPVVDGAAGRRALELADR